MVGIAPVKERMQAVEAILKLPEDKVRLAFLHWDIRQKKRSRKTGTTVQGYIFFKNNE